MTPDGTEGEAPRVVAVVGASGFVGRAVVTALRDRGACVLPISAPRFDAASSDVAAELEAQEADIHALAKQIAGCDALVNAAGVPDASSRDFASMVGANAVLPGVCARACHEAGTTRFVHVSSAVVQGHADVLDESDYFEPFSAYSRSKIEGELLAQANDPGELVIYRPPSVHASDRRITRAIARIAHSPLASVALPNAPTPQALVDNVGAAVAQLALGRTVGRVVIHPWEGLTTRNLLAQLGARRVVVIPAPVARAVISRLRALSRVFPLISPHARRLELLWFGQKQAPSSLTRAGWTPPVGMEGWSALGAATRRRPASSQ
jgi:nucleoside-diphosphate-sugar epimerase